MKQSIFHRSSRQYFFAGLLLCAGFCSCEKSGFTYDDTGGGQPGDYILTDTLTLQLKTILRDSVPTSETGVVLAGIKQDLLTGTIKAASFFRLAPPGQIPITPRAVYDSFRLVLRPSGYIAGDSTVLQEYTVHRVTQTIQPGNNLYYLYNHNNFTTDATPIGNFKGTIFPSTDKSVLIKMDDALGNNLFNMVRDKAGDVSSIEKFQDYFKGLCIRPGNNSSNIHGFIAQDTTLILRVYYHENDVTEVKKTIDFKMNANNRQFNQILTNRSNTPLAPLQAGNTEISSKETGNQAFTQYLTGIHTRIDIPYLRSFIQQGKYFKLLKVVLAVKPVAGTYGGAQRLPPTLALLEVDKKNNTTDTIGYGQLTIDDVFHENTAYTFDLSKYITLELQRDNFTTRGLMLSPIASDGNTTFDRLVVGDQQHPNNKISLQVYYFLYK